MSAFKYSPYPSGEIFFILVRIPDAESAPHIQFFRDESELLLDFRGKIHTFFRREHKRLPFEDLRTDMAMEAAKRDVFFRQCVGCDLFSGSVRDGKSEFTVRLRRLNIGVRMRLHSGIDAQENILCASALFRLAVDLIDLRVCVRHDTPHAGVESLFQFVVELIVAVHINFRRGKSRFERGIQFPAGNDVHADALLPRDAINGLAGKRLGKRTGPNRFPRILFPAYRGRPASSCGYTLRRIRTAACRIPLPAPRNPRRRFLSVPSRLLSTFLLCSSSLSAFLKCPVLFIHSIF